ncbi:hypothetical protein SI65_01423 [Aspergillus cristatus]|uniref:Uncharacterized protein n=1 Tax=Aspergillus cristatus TaxID=573508 RepID=A0A1E3BS78_ASPCR|nr:hypothetical protein SI65_01423 [Aspergillus cristatus]
MLKSLTDFDSLLFSRNIQLRDLSPWNTIIAQDPSVNPFTSPDPFSGLNPKRIVFVDFAGTDVVWARKYMSPEREKCLGKYISPLLLLDNYPPDEFSDWFNDWYINAWAEAEYAHTAASITPELREVFKRRFS